MDRRVLRDIFYYKKIKIKIKINYSYLETGRKRYIKQRQINKRKKHVLKSRVH